MTITALIDVTLAQEAVAGAPSVIHKTLAATRAFTGCLKVEVLMDADDETHVVPLSGTGAPAARRFRPRCRDRS